MELLHYRCALRSTCPFLLRVGTADDGSGDFEISKAHLRHGHEPHITNTLDRNTLNRRRDKRVQDLRASLLQKAEEELVGMKKMASYRTGFEEEERFGAVPVHYEQQLIIWNLKSVLGDSEARTFETKMRETYRFVDQYPNASTLDGERPSIVMPSSTSPSQDPSTRSTQSLPTSPTSPSTAKPAKCEASEVACRRGRPGRTFVREVVPITTAHSLTEEDELTIESDESGDMVVILPQSPRTSISPVSSKHVKPSGRRAAKRHSPPASASESKRRRLPASSPPLPCIRKPSAAKDVQSAVVDAYLPQRRPPSSPSVSTFSNSLESLLATLYSPGQSASSPPLTTVLAGAGVRSLEELAALLLVEKQSLQMLNESVKLQGASDEECIHLATFFSDLRVAAAEDGLPVDA
ncbi:hypothetical protein JCM11251_002570 [Rhodosporidiobolus azoricus]